MFTEVLEHIGAVSVDFFCRWLRAVQKSLSSLVEQPSQPLHQSALATALAEFEMAAAKLGGSISPSQYVVLEGMGGGKCFDASIAETVNKAVQTNAMTPSVARDFVDELTTGRADFLSTVRDALKHLQKLNITASALEPGSADVAFLIPRAIFDNELAQFAKELIFISRLLGHLSEALTGAPGQVELEELSSSVPTVALMASVKVISAVASMVNKFLETWERSTK